MRILGLAGLLLGLAIIGYVVVAYLNEATRVQATLDGGTRSVGEASTQPPRDLSRRGLEQRLSPILDGAKERAEQANRAADEN
jgi:hypothetical protein